MFKQFLALVACGVLMTNLMAQEKPSKEATTSVLNHKMTSLDGKEIDLNKYKGKVLVVVNVASECGLTPQYTKLQELHEKYADRGLVVLGFPCNQFGKQEPGTSKEIAQFCQDNYDVSFPMFEKTEVNGEAASPFYKQLTAVDSQPKGSGKVSWNFEKFVIGKEGKVAARFSPQTTPDDEQFIAAIERELAAR